jgi:hypothetical protein
LDKDIATCVINMLVKDLEEQINAIKEQLKNVEHTHKQAISNPPI